ncbi:MAG TPA: pentapeptide repeat-containing protein [Solirubrobacterales bacterium]|nr:pentapeptide repeat-containing protein [Solirubrobacterales bacterium]
MIQIKSWRDGKVLYTAETANDVKTALEEAVKARADLGYANLRYADLRYADLRSANLGSANLGSADLRSADLRSADLRYADLRYADLRSANLGSANLRYADLRSANLRSADLRYANLRSADLRYANLRSADLRYADLRSANLGSANLGSLPDDSHKHPLWVFRADFFAVLDSAPSEVAGVRKALVEGKVNGSTYRGDCACLVGTIANVAGQPIKDEIPDIVCGIKPDSSRPAEVWFMPIAEGHTADLDRAEHQYEGEFRATKALEWLDEWTVSRKAIAKALAPKRKRKPKGKA